MDNFKSFLKARDPSIVAGNRPNINPCVIMDLCPEFTESTINSENNKICDEHLKIYLRIKPTTDMKHLYNIFDKTLTCYVPSGSHAVRNIQDGNKLKKEFSFTRIYGPEVNQSEIFNDCVKHEVLNFINGRNCTVFTYGTSGSGKTYTILGTSENPGIIPRSLEYIFRTLTNVKNEPSIKPTPAGDIEKLETLARKNELYNKNILLGSTELEKSEHVETYKLMQQTLCRESAAVLDNPEVSVDLWVSFVEIYNEYIYDLLVPDPGKGKVRPKLRLAQDSKGNTYVKDLKIVNVSSGMEAYEILQYGMQNLNYACTSVNTHSSRSHCIFTIKLVQWISDIEVQVSQFSFCDLAGSERVKNTHNVKNRLKESNNINTSLLVLGRCIETIKKNQKSNDSRMIPYRDSKLTRLFQRALSGQESLTMVVNINTTRDMFDESQHVLNFSAIAKSIILEKVTKPEKINVKKRFSQYINKKNTNHLVNRKLEETDVLQEEIYLLQMQLENQEHLWAEKEVEIRKEVINVISKQYEEMKERAQSRFEADKQNLIETYEFKLEQLQNFYEKQLSKNSKRIRVSEVIQINDTDDEDDSDNLKYKLKIQKEEIEQIKNNFKITTEYSSSLQLNLTKLQIDFQVQSEALRNKEEKIKNLENEIKDFKKVTQEHERLICDAKEEIEEIEKEKKKLESDLHEKEIEIIELYKEKTDLSEQISAYIAAQNEYREHEEQLEEKLEISVESEQIPAHIATQNKCKQHEEQLEKTLEISAKSEQISARIAAQNEYKENEEQLEKTLEISEEIFQE